MASLVICGAIIVKRLLMHPQQSHCSMSKHSMEELNARSYFACLSHASSSIGRVAGKARGGGILLQLLQSFIIVLACCKTSATRSFTCRIAIDGTVPAGAMTPIRKAFSSWHKLRNAIHLPVVLVCAFPNTWWRERIATRQRGCRNSKWWISKLRLQIDIILASIRAKMIRILHPAQSEWIHLPQSPLYKKRPGLHKNDPRNKLGNPNRQDGHNSKTFLFLVFETFLRQYDSYPNVEEP
jgi:hypothetical protein